MTGPCPTCASLEPTFTGCGAVRPCPDAWHYPRPAGEQVVEVRRVKTSLLTVVLDVSGIGPMRGQVTTLGPMMPFAPVRLELRYEWLPADDERGLAAGWETRATVRGPGRNPADPLLFVRFWAGRWDSDHDDWPGWVLHHAEANHPDRPGGWPGDDPEGSYL